jgi:enamine deaminase RidA (YjgF/YER057c/UK114 family)
MQIVSGGVEAQTEQVLKNLKAVVEAGGSELGKVVKTTVRPQPPPKKKISSPWSNLMCILCIGFLEIYERFYYGQ